MLVEGATRRHRNLAEGAVVVVAVEQARRRVARDVDVGPSIVVEVCRRGPHPVRAGRPPVAAHEHHRRRAARARDAGCLRDVSKRPVSAIAVQEVRAASEAKWTAGHRNVVVATVRRVARSRRFLRIEVHITGDEQVQVTVAIEIQEAASCTPPSAGSRDACLVRDVGKRPVAVVVIQHVAALP